MKVIIMIKRDVLLTVLVTVFAIIFLALAIVGKDILTLIVPD